jgi:hypothetical protein
VCTVSEIMLRDKIGRRGLSTYPKIEVRLAEVAFISFQGGALPRVVPVSEIMFQGKMNPKINY